MLQLLQPISLFAISGIAIPIIIHLWNNRKGKTLKVGSILLLQENVTQQARSLRLTELLLLMLRCLLIILLAFILARPVWKTNLTSANEKGWLLIEKQALQETYKNFKPVIDSLVNTGYKFHYFNTGFKADNIEDALKNTDTSTHRQPSYWTLLKQLNEQVPAELPVYLFTSNQLKRFEGIRPGISMNLKWSTYTAVDTVTDILASAYKTYRDSVRVVTAISDPNATIYSAENVPRNGNNIYKLIDDKGKTLVRSANDTVAQVEVDTSGLDIIIYTDGFTNDANYLKAAVEAIRQYTERALNVSIASDLAAIKPDHHWLFWLSEKPLPMKELLPGRIFIYEKGKEQPANSWIIPIYNFPVNYEPVPLTRLIRNASPVTNLQAVWKDGFGNALLSLDKTEKFVYHFYSRFNPEWNELVWSPQFVEMMFDLLIQPGVEIKDLDKRIIDTAQFQPQKAHESKAFDKEKFVEITDLTKLFWLIAFIIFCIERYLSLKPQNQ